MLALRARDGAPRMTRAQRRAGARRGPRAARGRARRTRADARRATDARTRTGLREDQAAAALAVLTDGRRVSVINAPAGSGKTWVLAAAGRAWAAAGLGRGHRDHAVPVGPQHPGRRSPGVLQQPPSSSATCPAGAAPAAPSELRPGDLVLIDEASMVATPDLADVITQAAAAGAKVILAGRYPAAAGGGKRRRHVPARRRPRLRPAHRTGPVPRRLGTGRQPAAPRRATPACWPSTTSTAGSSAATRSR